jgi:hypothetical protein
MTTSFPHSNPHSPLGKEESNLAQFPPQPEQQNTSLFCAKENEILIKPVIKFLGPRAEAFLPWGAAFADVPPSGHIFITMQL